MAGHAEEADTEIDSSIVDRIREKIPLALAVIVGIFVALGIDGDIRDRVIRNAPGYVAGAFALSVLGLALPLFYPRRDPSDRSKKQSHRGRRNALGIVSGVLLLAGAGTAVFVGTYGLSERENPSLVILPTLVDATNGTVRVEVTADAPTLRSNEKMLVRLAVVRFAALAELESLCSSAQISPLPHRDDVQERLKTIGEPARVVHWGESGPDTKGRASSKVIIEVDRREFPYVCAYSGLLPREGERPSEGRVVVAHADLRTAAPVR